MNGCYILLHLLHCRPFVPPFYLPMSVLEDVAAAHVLAMLTPSASGRYIIVNKYVSLQVRCRGGLCDKVVGFMLALAA